MRLIFPGVVASALLAASAGAGRPEPFAPPVVAVWYRGTPAGTPVLDDLAAIEATGFAAIVWPAEFAGAAADLRSKAASVDLDVSVRAAPAYLSPDKARAPGVHVDVPTAGDPRAITPLVWRAVAHGARSIAFDPGQPQGTGLTGRDGRPAAWLPAAVAIARQLSANARLVDVLGPGPRVTIARAPKGLEVVLLDGGRAWVIVATNLSAAAVKSTVSFPKGIPYGLWASWIDDSGMSMLALPSGPRWTLELEGWGTRVYFIDKLTT